jgi:hypothetical protein
VGSASSLKRWGHLLDDLFDKFLFGNVATARLLFEPSSVSFFKLKLPSIVRIRSRINVHTHSRCSMLRLPVDVGGWQRDIAEDADNEPRLGRLDQQIKGVFINSRLPITPRVHRSLLPIAATGGSVAGFDATGVLGVVGAT